jgi:repressor LexA
MAKTTQDKLNRTLQFITNFVNQFGYPPTVREICKELNVSSSATAHYYLDKLEQQGLIKRSSTKNRAIEVVGIKNLLLIHQK